MDQVRVGWAVTPEHLGEELRRAREARGFTQEELAERLGVGRMTVSRLERGGAVSVATLVRALSECGCAVLVAPKQAKVRVDD